MPRKPKKRGPKPGSKRGPYKKARRPSKITPDSAQYAKLFEASDAKIGSPLRIRLPKDFAVTDDPNISVGNLPSMISDLASTIDTLEAQLTAQIDRIKSILK